jgi:predicted transcriptional regulator
VFSKPDSILLSTERIVNEALERRAYMQMTKKGEQLLKNVKDFVVLQ